MSVGLTSPTSIFEVVGAYQSFSSTNGTGAFYSSDTQAAGVGGTIALGGQDGTSAQRTFASIGGFKENGTSGNYASYLAFATRANGSLPTEAMRITSSGSVGIGTTSPGQKLDVSGNVNVTGTVYTNLLQLTSDRRLKQNIQPMDAAVALDHIAALRPVSFEWKRSGKSDMGLIAQELSDVYPALVKPQADGKLTVEYVSLIAPLIAAVQELKRRDDVLEADNAALRRQLRNLGGVIHLPVQPKAPPE